MVHFSNSAHFLHISNTNLKWLGRSLDLIAYGGLELDVFNISRFCEQNDGHPPENLAAI